MTQYIDKSVVVAKIERLLNENKVEIQRATDKHLEEYFEGYEDALVLFKEKFLDTLEVKEVNFYEELKEWHKQHFKKKDTFEKYSGFYFTNHTQIELAKHFFKLGLKAQKA